MRTLVLGAGVSGMAAARLAARSGHRVLVHDPDEAAAAAASAAGFASATGSWEAGLLEGMDLVVVSPGIPERSPAVTDTLEAGVRLIGELELAWSALPPGIPTVAVTGTNGKTTVTSLVAEMLTDSGLRAPALGNIGRPMSDVVGEPPQVVVVEVSSFQLRFTETFAPAVAVVVNVAPDHLDWHGSFGAYLEAKASIVVRQGPDDLLIHDAADAGAAQIAHRAPGQVAGVPEWGVGPEGYGIDRVGGRLVAGPVEVPLDELAVTDRAFLVDLVLAGAAALAVGADPGSVARAWRRFAPASHRRTEVGVVAGVTYVDDSKATNPHAALAAIRAYPSVVLVAGGIDKGLDVSPLPAEPNVRAVVAIGRAAPALLAAAGDRGVGAGSMQEAVDTAARLARPGDVVLLAPGCSSFDMFTSYAHRGDEFAAAVARLAQGAADGRMTDADAGGPRGGVR